MFDYFKRHLTGRELVIEIKDWFAFIGAISLVTSTVLATISFGIGGMSAKSPKGSFTLNVIAFTFLILGAFLGFLSATCVIALKFIDEEPQAPSRV